MHLQTALIHYLDDEDIVWVLSQIPISSIYDNRDNIFVFFHPFSCFQSHEHIRT